MDTATDTDTAAAALDLTIDRRFAAPPALIWRMWADRDHLQRWWGPKDMTCTALDWDFREGGAWRACIETKAHGENWMAGRFRAIEPERRIVFSFAWDHGKPGAESVITVTFEPEGDGTRQRFHQVPFADEASRDSHRSGWDQFLDRADAYAVALAAGNRP